MLGQNNTVCRTDMTHSRHTDLTRRRNVMNNLVVAPSFNGRTADSGSAYRGSNPWGAAKCFQALPRQLALPHSASVAPELHFVAELVSHRGDRSKRCLRPESGAHKYLP